jgi:hypothetical protein
VCKLKIRNEKIIDVEGNGKAIEIVDYLANTHGRFAWNDRPFTRADFVSKFVNISLVFALLFDLFNFFRGTSLNFLDLMTFRWSLKN